MSNRGLLKDSVHKRAARHSRKLSVQRLSAYVGASLGALVLAVVVLVVLFGGAILNRYGKAKVERMFADTHPGSALRIGELNYAMGANRLVAQSVTLIATNTTLKVGRISLTGVRWAGLLRGTVVLNDVLAQTSLEATNLDVEFSQAQYGFHCSRLQASVPGSELIAEGSELYDRWWETKHSSRRTLFEHHGFVSSCRSAGCLGSSMEKCSRENHTGPGRFIFPAPRLTR